MTVLQQYPVVGLAVVPGVRMNLSPYLVWHTESPASGSPPPASCALTQEHFDLSNVFCKKVQEEEALDHSLSLCQPRWASKQPLRGGIP